MRLGTMKSRLFCACCAVAAATADPAAADPLARMFSGAPAEVLQEVEVFPAGECGEGGESG